MAIDGWRNDIDFEGWKVREVHDRIKAQEFEELNEKLNDHSHNYPKQVKSIPRLINDLHALKFFTKSHIPQYC